MAFLLGGDRGAVDNPDVTIKLHQSFPLLSGRPSLS